MALADKQVCKRGFYGNLVKGMEVPLSPTHALLARASLLFRAFGLPLLAVAGVQVANPTQDVIPSLEIPCNLDNIGHEPSTEIDSEQTKHAIFPEDRNLLALNSYDSLVDLTPIAFDSKKTNDPEDYREKNVILCQSHIRGYLTRLKYRSQGRNLFCNASQS